MHRESRERKPSALYNSDALNDKAFTKVLREYQKQKAVKKKDVPAEPSAPVVTDNPKPTSHKYQTGKVAKHGGGRGRQPAQAPVLSPQAMVQHEIEERHIAACREVSLKSAKPRKPLPEGAVELDDIATAVKRGVKETTTLLLDWSNKKAKMIGNLCKVYWDGEDTWFYARILNYDSFYDRHYIYYLEDSTAEWIDLENEIVLVAEEMVLARLNPGGAPWAAQRYWISEKAHSVCHNFPGFHKGGEYVEYLSDQRNKEYAFLQRKCLDPMQDKYLPSKQSAAFKRSMKAAENEQQAIDEVVEAVQNAMQDAIFGALHGDQWVGHRVRAATHRIVQRGENRSQVLEQGSAYSVGTIRRFRPSTGEHLVVFDDALLQPQWVECRKSTIDVLLGANAARADADPSLAARPSSSTNAVASGSSDVVTCVPCGAPGSHSSGHDGADYTHQKDCVLCACSLEVGTVKQCEGCRMKCHTYCAAEETGKAPTAANSSSAHHWGTSSVVPWKCWNCVVCYGCSANSWDKALLAWNVRRIEPEAPDLDILVCGDCLYRYKYESNFCPSCFKLYAVDESMLPLVPVPLSDAAAGVSASAPGGAVPTAGGADGDDGDEGEQGGDSEKMDVEVEEPAPVEGERVASSGAEEAHGDHSDVEEQEEKGGGGGVVQASAAAEGEHGSDHEGEGEQDHENGDAKPSAPPLPLQTGLSEDNMVQCNECSRWVHAHCEGIDQAQYDAMTLGTHPIWGNEYLCPLCRVKTSQNILRKLANEDKTGMFAEPVTERVARNYYDIIRNPMDMATMWSKATRGLYKSLQPMRQDFELMCLNAIVFNRKGDEYWREARRFFEEVERLFRLQKRQTHVSAFGVELQERVAEYEAELEAAKAAKSKKRKGAHAAETGPAAAESAELSSKRLKLEGAEDRSVVGSAGAGVVSSGQGLAEDGTTSSAGQLGSKDAAAVAAPVTPTEPDFDLDEQIYIPNALAPNPDPVSYLPCSVVSQSIEEAYHLMSHDRCLVCGCSGRAELLLFCVDCGEAVHSFCAEAPLSTMPEAARAGWRCMNCKICEVCHTNTENESVGKMLYCEGCDFAYHSHCLTPKVAALPEGSWYCADCVQCTACALLAPDGQRHPCWGVDLSICYACHELAQEQKRAEEARAAEQARLNMLRDSADNCNICFAPYAGEAVLMCTVCGRNTHIGCNAANAVPMPNNDLESYRDFMCRRCVDEYLPSCTSHVGTGVSAALLLQCVARIQRKRWVERYQARERKLAALEQERKVVFDAFRPALKAMVVWGALRAQWFLTYHPSQSVAAGAQRKTQLNFGSARALRFMAMWKRKTSACGLPLSQRRAHLLQGLDEGGQEMSSERVVRVAALAAAFLEATNTEVRAFVPKEEELVPVLQFANSQALVNTTGSSVRPVFTAEHLEECLEKLCRQPIGFDSGELPLAFCAGVKLFSEGQQLPSKTQQFTHGGAVALPWLPGNVVRGTLLTVKSRPGYQYKTQPLPALPANEAGLGSSNSAVVVGAGSSASTEGGALVAPPRSGASQAPVDVDKTFKDPVSVDAVHGEGYYARKARQFGLVPKNPSQPQGLPIAAVLRSPQVTLMASALELVARDVAEEADAQARAAAATEAQVQSVRWDVSRMDPVTRQVFDTLDWIVKEVEAVAVREAARAPTGPALAAAYLQQKKGVQRGMVEIATALSRVGEATAAAQATYCFQCEPFDPEAYTFAASPVAPSHGSRLLPAWQDPRSCCLCLEGGEDGVTGRLLPNVDGTHVHSNCLRWSPDIVESDGVLRNAKLAKDRAGRTSCFFCSRKGATVCCTNRKKCRRAFHLRCAMLSQCVLIETMPGARSPAAAHELQCFALCPEHAPSVATEYPGLTQLWRPYDPTRPLLLDENQDANFTSELLSQRRSDKAVRSGSLTVLSIGKPLPRNPEFYSAQFIYAHRFKAARIYWSGVTPLVRTLYVFEILQHSDLECLDAAQMEYVRGMLEQSEQGTQRATNTAGRAPTVESPDRPIFRLVALDNAAQPIFSYSVEFAFRTVVHRARTCNQSASAVRPTVADVSVNSTTAHQFFGLSVPFVRKGIEMLPQSLGMMVTLDKSEPRTLYAPVYCLPTKHDALLLQQQLLRSQDGLAASANGCARADGYGQLDKRIVGKRVTRILAKVADADPAASNNKSGKAELNKYEQKDDDEENKRVNEALRSRYQDMTAAYLENPYAKLDVRKSGIHGWGLFAKINFEQNDIIVEYIGQKIRQVVADKREVQYEVEGVGSCYLFRLDKDDIIDATRRGGMARFINHCCEPNAYARVISAPAPGLSAPDEKHIIIMAARDIQEGEEITYDYKFPIEDDKLKCYCGAPRCGGFMN